MAYLTDTIEYLINMKSSENEARIVNRYKGCLVGGAVGDALGAPAEFLSTSQIRAEFGIVNEMVGGGFFKWRPGQFTDDTDQTLAIVDSLIENGRYVPEDIARRFLVWYQNRPVDIGNTTALSLSELEAGVNFKDSGKLALAVGKEPANGSLMRTAPIGLYFRRDLQKLDEAAAEVSAITHAHHECVLACQMTSRLVALLAEGFSKDDSLELLYQRFCTDSAAEDKLNRAIRGEVYPGKIGYVFNTFGIALKSFLRAETFEDAVIWSIHFGGDTDTQATVAGSLAGAFWGIDQIPIRWKGKLNPVSAGEIEQKAEKLYKISML